LHARLAHLAPALTGIAADVGDEPPRPDVASATPDLDDAVASIAFNVPTSMTLDRRTLIQLALGSTAAPGPDGMTRSATDAPQRIAQYMEARLSGSDFQIEPVTADTQALGSAKATEWLWLVTPKKPGRHQLHLTVTAVADQGSAPVRRALPTFEHSVDVGVAWQDTVRRRAAPYADWLWAALWMSPLLLLWAYARWRRKHRRWFHGGL
jgi:hypothetical protein